MMSQNSHWKGQPREYWTDIALYRLRSASRNRQSALRRVPAARRPGKCAWLRRAPDPHKLRQCLSASPRKIWSASGKSSMVVTYGPPRTTRLPALCILDNFLSDSFCTSIAVAKTMSAHSISDVFNCSTLRSTNRRSQESGSNAETVNNPSGGNAQRLPSNGNACRKLQ